MKNHILLSLLLPLVATNSSCFGQGTDELSKLKILLITNTQQESSNCEIEEAGAPEIDSERFQSQKNVGSEKFENEFHANEMIGSTELPPFKKTISLSRDTVEPRPQDEFTNKPSITSIHHQNILKTPKNVQFESGYFLHRPLIFDDPLLEEHGLTLAEPRQSIYSGIRFFAAGFLDPIFRTRHPFRGCESRATLPVQPGDNLK